MSAGRVPLVVCLLAFERCVLLLSFRQAPGLAGTGLGRAQLDLDPWLFDRVDADSWAVTGGCSLVRFPLVSLS